MMEHMMIRSRPRLTAALFFAAGVGFAMPLSAQGKLELAPGATAASAAPAPYVIHGFRSVTFGMNDAQVRAAIAKDFPGTALRDVGNTAERTRALQVNVAHLEPGPGSALVTYIFGASSKVLTHVNVVWTVDGNPTEDQRSGIVAAAAQLTDYFRSLPNPPRASVNVTPLGPNALVMFAAADGKGAGLEVAVEGIRYTRSDASAPSPEPTGPAILRVSYLANVANPDIYRVKPGAF
jgi:hypothetical protein